MYEKMYEKIADALVSDGYIVVENAFGMEFCKNLLLKSKNGDNFKKAGISASSNLHIDTNRRRDKISWLQKDGSVSDNFLEFADALKRYLNKELYLGLSYYEAHFAIYEKGDFYETHLDCFKGYKNRVVTSVYYMNEKWRDEDGGELVIYDENYNALKTLQPKADTLVVFMSERFPHEVRVTNKRRYSIAGWFRVDKRE